MSHLDYIRENFTELTDGRYAIVGEYRGIDKPLRLKCLEHNCEFDIPQAERLYHIAEESKSKRTYRCPECSKLLIKPRRSVQLECAYCGKKFERPFNWNRNNVTSLAFCCREHKDLAQRKASGVPELFEVQYRNHSTAEDGTNDYRQLAFMNYPVKCAICGYHEYVEGLEVHHIDGSRDNNSLDNLVILCATCHRVISFHRKDIVKDGDSFYWTDVTLEKQIKLKRRNAKGWGPGIRIRCIEDDKVFPSATSAGEYYNVSSSTILHNIDYSDGFCGSINKTFEKLSS